MRYWLHRCKYEGGWDILDEKKLLTIGYSECAKSKGFCKLVHTGMEKYHSLQGGCLWHDDIYFRVYGEEGMARRHSLYHFVFDMCKGDIVVVPRKVPFFSVYRLLDCVRVSEYREERDIGFEWSVECILENVKLTGWYTPLAGLAKRMKCRQTTLEIADLAGVVEGLFEEYERKLRNEYKRKRREDWEKEHKDDGQSYEEAEMAEAFLGGGCGLSDLELCFIGEEMDDAMALEGEIKELKRFEKEEEEQ